MSQHFTPGAPWVTVYFAHRVYWCTYTFCFALTWQVLANPAFYLPMVSEFDSSLLSDRIPSMLTRLLS